MDRPLLAISFLLRDRYGEDDPQEFKVSVAGDAFSGELEILHDHQKLKELCSVLDGFPTHQGDSVQFSLGMHHKLQLSFECADTSGHLLLTAALVGEFYGPPRTRETLSVVIRCDPASIDSFCTAIQQAQPRYLAEATVYGRRVGQ